MGIKIKFKNLLIFIFTTLILISGKSFAQTCPTNLSDSQKIVKVAINSTGFKSLVYNQIPIIATANFAAYDKDTKTQIAKFNPTDIALVKYADSKFEISVNGKVVAKDITNPVVFDCQFGLLGVDKLTRNSKQALYHGVFELTPKNETQFFLINVLDLQSYLKGVVPNEMPVRFGLEALKAQTIAARNYVLMPRTRTYKEFDVDDSVASQVYFGAMTENPLSNRAVDETDGLVALYDWDLILAQYCSTAGGYTENYENAFSDRKNFPGKEKPYLKGRPDMLSVGPLNREEEARIFYMSCPDSYDMKSPYYRWQKEFTREELEGVLAKTLIDQSKAGFVKPEFKQGEKLGELKELKVNKRGVSGKIMELEIVFENQTYHVSKELVIRRLIQKNGISLPSANAVFENLYDENKKLNKTVIYGGGFGHGVGMSQFGAGFMGSSLGKPFDKILKRYYTGITVSTVPVILSTCEGQKIVTQQFFAPYNRAILVVDNKYQIKEFNAIINEKNVGFELANSIVPFKRMNRIDISSYIKQGKNTITFYFPENEENKALRAHIELVEKDDSGYNF